MRSGIYNAISITASHVFRKMWHLKDKSIKSSNGMDFPSVLQVLKTQFPSISKLNHEEEISIKCIWKQTETSIRDPICQTRPVFWLKHGHKDVYVISFDFLFFFGTVFIRFDICLKKSQAVLMALTIKKLMCLIVSRCIERVALQCI